MECMGKMIENDNNDYKKECWTRLKTEVYVYEFQSSIRSLFDFHHHWEETNLDKERGPTVKYSRFV